MIPEKLEYLFLLTLLALLIGTFLGEATLRLLKKRSFWISCALLCATWTLIEIHALRQHWWVFSPNKLCGYTIATVPIEEYIVFVLIHTAVVATYEAFRRLDELA